MSGWVKLTKQFSNDELWHNVTAFRLYVWIIMKAAYEDGKVLNGVRLKKGQYVRAYSQLGEDLMYIEGRAKKALAKSTVKRAVDKLVNKGLLLAEETHLGTLFTVVNSDDFTCLDGTGDFFCTPFRETTVEQSLNDNKTMPEQYIRTQESKKLKNDDDPHPSQPNNQVPSNNQKAKRIERITTQFITLRNNGTVLSPKDETAIERIGELPLKTEQLESLLEGVFNDYHRKNPNGKISSALYCEKVLRTILEADKNGNHQKKPLKDSMGKSYQNRPRSSKESISERVERLIEEGKIVLEGSL
ncbi:hypothetical protein [Neobacillus sp. FSL H8-0543]|uniref:hypothetical protein n=1 Tax=Neobacillus sp. FSL H8-0543 TaxID=2954672 RepID=UPI003159191A